MLHDRNIVITIGNNRKSVSWQPLSIALSEFYEKLRVPSRSTETMQAYLSLKKSEQDDLKDIGGFVAGSLRGVRRKAGAVTGRDLITLDFDNIPAGGTDDIALRTSGLGCGYCIYSTRKHTPAKPRLRLLFPLSPPLAWVARAVPIFEKKWIEVLLEYIKIRRLRIITFAAHR